MNKKSIRRLLILFVISAAAAALLIPNMIYRMNEKLVEQELVIEDIDISNIADKTFTGSYKSGQMSADVEVVIQNGQYVSVTLTDYAGINPSRAQQVADAIVEYQSLLPDTQGIGSQYTDKIVQKAVYYAIRYSYQNG